MKKLVLVAIFAGLQVCSTVKADDSKLLDLTPLNSLKDLITPTTKLDTGDLRGLINALNGYALTTLEKPALTGIRLAPPLSDVFNAVKDIYKSLYLADEEFSKEAVSVTKGNITTGVVQTEVKHKLSDGFLQALIYSIVLGKFEGYLIPIIKAYKTHIEKVKEEKTGY